MDAGTTGWKHFLDFKEHTIDGSRVRILAFLNIACRGMVAAESEQTPAEMDPRITASLVLAFFVTLPQGLNQITAEVFWPPFAGGLIWAVSGYCAFTATSKIGMARASGIWSPLNIVVSLFWGAAIFSEFLNTGTGGLIALIISVAVIIVGVLLIIFARGRGDQTRTQRDLTIGVLGAIGVPKTHQGFIGLFDLHR